jgi:hypothetical protein
VLTAAKHWAPAAPSLNTSPLVNSFQPASPRAFVLLGGTPGVRHSRAQSGRSRYAELRLIWALTVSLV